MPILRLALASLLNRKTTAALTVLSIALSVALLLSVERMRAGAKQGFANTISGTDLIVGARSGQVQLLLFSVFRIGNATNSITWQSYQQFANDRNVAWTIPMSLGDSHRGYRVLGTTGAYFEHFRYGRKQPLELADGVPFDDLFDAVLGAEVATALGYSVGDPIVVAHGLGSEGFLRHDETPFRVAGILAPTGTPVDRTVHVSLQAIEAIHVDWRSGARIPGMTTAAEVLRKMELKPKSITAFLVGLESRFAVFGLQRSINEYRGEPLLAILPGVALQELWSLMSTAEIALSAITVCVVASGLIGMTVMLLAGLRERRREMAVLRSIGAQPRHIFTLMVSEAVGLTLAGCVVGLALTFAAMTLVAPLIEARLGLHLAMGGITIWDAKLLALVIASGTIAGFLPAALAVRQSIADGTTVRT
jgi:putative ABC transport system permease protein